MWVCSNQHWHFTYIQPLLMDSWGFSNSNFQTKPRLGICSFATALEWLVAVPQTSLVLSRILHLKAGTFNSCWCGRRAGIGVCLGKGSISKPGGFCTETMPRGFLIPCVYGIEGMLHTPRESTSSLTWHLDDNTMNDHSVLPSLTLQVYPQSFISLAFPNPCLTGDFEPCLQVPSQEPETKMLKPLGKR